MPQDRDQRPSTSSRKRSRKRSHQRDSSSASESSDTSESSSDSGVCHKRRHSPDRHSSHKTKKQRRSRDTSSSDSSSSSSSSDHRRKKKKKRPHKKEKKHKHKKAHKKHKSKKEDGEAPVQLSKVCSRNSGTLVANMAVTVTAASHKEVLSQGRRSSAKSKSPKRTKRGTRTDRKSWSF